MRANTRHYIRALIVLGFSLGVIACDQSSCDCMAPIPGGISPQQVMVKPVQVRLTDSGITFLEQNLEPIVSSFMEGGLTFPIDPDSGSFGVGDYELCPGSPCMLTARIISVDLNPQQPNRLNVVLRIDLEGTIKVKVKVLFSDTCNVRLTIDDNQGKEIPAAVVFNVDATTAGPDGNLGRLTFDVVDVNVDITDNDFDISGGVLCSLSNIGFIKGILVDQLMGSFDIESMLTDALGDFKCQKCTSQDACPTKLVPNAVCDGLNPNDPNSEGQCMSGGNCIAMPLGMEGRVDLGELLADFAPGMKADLDVMAVAGGGPTNMQQNPVIFNNGLSINLMGGTDSETNPCVPITVPPGVRPVPDASFRTQNKVDFGDGNGAQDFHIGIGVHEYFVDDALWDAFNSGVLCLALGTDTISELGALKALIPSFGQMADANPGFKLGLRPTAAPIVDIGEGVSHTEDDGSGNTIWVNDKPLLQVTLKDLVIDFYGYMYERYDWLFGVKTDLVLPIDLEIVTDAQTGVMQALPVIDLSDPDKMITNLSVIESEVLAEDPQKLEEAFPALLGVALPMLTGSLGQPIDLVSPSDLQGFVLNVKEVRGVDPSGDTECSIDPAKGGCYAFLGIFADLGFDPDALNNTNPMRVTTDTVARIVEKNVPLYNGEPDMGHAYDWKVPGVVLELSAPGSEKLGEPEFMWRVDNGTWSRWTSANRVKVSHPRFWMFGPHQIEVRSRVKGMPRTMDPEPYVVQFLMDPIPPKVSLTIDGMSGLLDVYAEDFVTPDELLQFSYALEGGRWTDWANIEPVDLSGYDYDNISVDVRVRDEEGNVGHARLKRSGGVSEHYEPAGNPGPDGQITEWRQVPASTSHGTAYESEPAMGCNASGNGSAGAFVLLLAALALLIRKR